MDSRQSELLGIRAVILAASFLFITSAVLFTESLNAVVTPGQEGVRRHIVRPGETLGIIAQNYGFEMNELAEYNKINSPNNLMAGQTIYLPDPQPAPFAPNQAMPVPVPEQILDTSVFPPEEIKPDEKEYYQLQQWMGSQKETSGVDSVDYNYSIKAPAPESKAGFDIPLDVSEETVKKVNGEEAAKVAESDTPGDDTKADPDLAEFIDDSASPALDVFGDRPYAYYGSGEELSETLQNFAASYYLPAVIAEDVLGEVNGKIGPLTPVDFLDHMANIYGFIWYFDGHTLYVYSGNAAQQKIISLEYMSTEEFKKTLKKVGIWDGRFFWKEQSKDGLVYVSGPPRYIEMVSQTADLLDKKEGVRQKSKLTIRMYRLKYAWATDKQFNFRGQEVTVPGVATLLRSIIAGGGIASVKKKTIDPLTVQPAKGVVKKGIQQRQFPAEADPLNKGPELEGNYINADPRLNAVIVHDLEAKMPMYEGLIESLDKPSSQVEVSVSIIDVNTDDIEALGVDWNNTRGAAGTDPGSSEVNFDLSKSSHKDSFSSFTTVLGLNVGSFNARVNLLEDEGRAKVVSKPSILTLDNLEAIFDNSSTFYVPVASQEDAELFPVTSGTVVQVTPRIVREDTGRRIHMNVNIQDGGDTKDANLTIPRVNNSSISTQAIVNENESLLIGGFYKESESQKATKVPVLGDIPVFGKLFRADRKQVSSQVRLFLITPRILNNGA
ncbi:EscC/YscC/HrcC family type III secretion system outer membrane ring protein [Endozoicomonas sp. OPT23]|uniref:type III secretion system outer membrane ring subunit SctC n=1 Tax=Endozoicomonas sp. OPT23 TaxID=2072845 RepID=UPI00129BE38B|nr:type III secretion system outer membrane ring subunit SctC [Endozoicomonas sp. OPT23]MRI32185.1 EscC/YscC/HrcC family type III secretion system outer membrane ring protein [Endozoicomonas sp. OPT23]